MSLRSSIVALTTIIWLAMHPVYAADVLLTLKKAEQQALKTDPRLSSGLAVIESALAEHDAAGQLPEPRLKLAAMNMPVDTFNFDQEAMTSLQLGIQQSIPSGLTLELEKSTALEQAQLRQYEVEVLRKTVLQELRTEWLQTWAGQAQSELIEEQRQLFESLLPSVKGAYRAGSSKQSDVARIRLRISELKDEYIQLQGKKESGLAGIGRWGIDVSNQLPQQLPQSLQTLPPGEINNHPELSGTQSLMEISRYQIELSEQRYKAAWGIEASYGWREERSDLVSLGVSLSLPLFAKKSLDADLAAKQKSYQAARESVRNTRLELETEVNRLHSRYRTINRRINSYQQDILPELEILQTLSRAEYRSGRGDFSHLLESEDAVIDARRVLLNLSIEKAKTIIALRFLLEEQQS